MVGHPLAGGWHVFFVFRLFCCHSRSLSVIPISLRHSRSFSVIPGLTGNLANQVEEFVAGAFVFKEDSAEGRCGGYRIGLLHASQGHAGV